MELNTTNDTSRVEAVTRFAGSSVLTDRDPGAHAPGFMLSCATRTAKLQNKQNRKPDPHLQHFSCNAENIGVFYPRCHS